VNRIIIEDAEIISSGDLDLRELRDCSILVTGATGMLGSYIVRILLNLNDIYPGIRVTVIAMCRNLQKAKEKFYDLLDNTYLVITRGELSEPLAVPGPVDYIIHAASLASSEHCRLNPSGVIIPNVIGTRNLLDMAKEKKSRAFLFLSSGEVYGESDKIIITETDIGSLDPTELRNCYGESKRMGESMCVAWSNQFGLSAMSVRLVHTYGPTLDLNNDHRVFAEFVADIVNGRDIVMKSDGLAERGFCYSADAMDGFLRVLLKGKTGESYNIGNMGAHSSIKNLAETLVSLFPEMDLKVIQKERAEGDAHFEHKNKRPSIMSTAKIESLGFKCRFDISKGFYRTIKSFITMNR
jgi:nucleoside-diphosphate-sugar epimerase